MPRVPRMAWHIAAMLLHTAIAAHRLCIQLSYGVTSYDAFSYMCNAMTLAGLGSYFEYNRPLGLSFIASLAFRVLGPSELAYLTICACFYVLSSLSLYAMLTTLVSYPYAIAGSLVYALAPPVYLHSTSGLADIPSVALASAAMALAFHSLKKPKLAFAIPLLVAASSLIREASAFVVLPLASLYLATRSFRQLAHVAKGGFLALLMVLPMWLAAAKALMAAYRARKLRQRTL